MTLTWKNKIYEINRLDMADLLLKIENLSVDFKGADRVIRRAARSAKPIQLANTIIKNKTRLKGKSLLAYAGIADPDKFFSSLVSVGAKLIERRAFGDHHHYSPDDIEQLAKIIESLDGITEVITTQKDLVKMSATQIAGRPLRALTIEADFGLAETELDRLLQPLLGDEQSP